LSHERLALTNRSFQKKEGGKKEKGKKKGPVPRKKTSPKNAWKICRGKEKTDCTEEKSSKISHACGGRNNTEDKKAMQRGEGAAAVWGVKE